MAPEETVQSYLKRYGHGRDVTIPDQLFEEWKYTLHQSWRSLPKNGPTYRDDRRMHSVHAVDLRDQGGVVVGHLEWFNPEYHPVLHALIDYPFWYLMFYWNTVRTRVLERIVQV